MRGRALNRKLGDYLVRCPKCGDGIARQMQGTAWCSCGYVYVKQYEVHFDEP